MHQIDGVIKVTLLWL